MTWRAGEQWSASILVSKERTLAYAAASGDDNPIHTNDFAARGVGFSGVVAHGMAVFAAALHAMLVPTGRTVVESACRFVAPVVLPAAGERELRVDVVALNADTAKAEVRDDDTLLIKIEIRCQPEEIP